MPIFEEIDFKHDKVLRREIINNIKPRRPKFPFTLRIPVPRIGSGKISDTKKVEPENKTN
jgi:hypothetical protein